MADRAADLQQLSHRNESNSGRMFTALRSQQSELERYAERVKALDAELARLHNSIAELTSGGLELRVTQLAGQLEDTRAKLAAAEAGEAAAKRQLAEAHAELNAMHEAHVKSDAEIAAAAAAAPNRFGSVDEATKACLRSEAEVRRLREQLAPMRASQALLARERDHLSAYKQETQGVRAQLAAKERELEASQLEVRGLREAVARSLDHQLEIDRQLTEVLGSDFAREFRDAIGAPPAASSLDSPDAPAAPAVTRRIRPWCNAHAVVDAVVTAIVRELGGASFRWAISARLGDDLPPENAISTALASFFTLGGAGADDDDEDTAEYEDAARQEASAYLRSVLHPHEDAIAAAALAPLPATSRLQATALRELAHLGEAAEADSVPEAVGAAEAPAPAGLPPPRAELDRVPPPARVSFALGPAAATSAHSNSAASPAALPVTSVPSTRAVLPPAAASMRSVRPEAPSVGAAASGRALETAAPRAATSADTDFEHKNQIGEAAASRKALRAAAERGDPISVIDNELRASPLLRELLDPRVFVRISATTFAPLEMLQAS